MENTSQARSSSTRVVKYDVSFINSLETKIKSLSELELRQRKEAFILVADIRSDFMGLADYFDAMAAQLEAEQEKINKGEGKTQELFQMMQKKRELPAGAELSDEDTERFCDICDELRDDFKLMFFFMDLEETTKRGALTLPEKWSEVGKPTPNA